MKFEKNMGTEKSRRKFLKDAGLSAAALAGMPLMAAGSKEYNNVYSRIRKYLGNGNIILFQGDSITDAGRDKKKQLSNHTRSFGTGYAFLAASGLLREFSVNNLQIYNRGISGNKVYQLAERWQQDCLDLKPDMLSILIGVNDYWHFRNGKYDGTPEKYEVDYRNLLLRTRKEFPDIKLVICEPFILTGTTAVDESWLQPFKEYQKIAAKLSDEFGAVWVPFQKSFDKAIETAPAAYWAADGVHPSMAGCQIMAETWLKSVSRQKKV